LTRVSEFDSRFTSRVAGALKMEERRRLKKSSFCSFIMDPFPFMGAMAYICNAFRIGAGVAELARLESVCTGNRTVGSNPTLSATP
jgi:hypothetical protein